MTVNTNGTLLETGADATMFEAQKEAGATHHLHKKENALQHVGALLQSDRKHAHTVPHQVDVAVGEDHRILSATETKQVVKGLHHSSPKRTFAHKPSQKDAHLNHKANKSSWEKEAQEGLEEYQAEQA